MRRLRQSFPVFLALAAFAGCEVGPDYHRPKIKTGADFGERSGPATTRASDLTADAPIVAWWTTFHDDTLNDLVRRALRENLDLQRAGVRVREARAQRAAAFSGLFPTLTGNASFENVHTSENGISSQFGGGGASSGGGGGGGAGAGGAGGGGLPVANGSPAVPGGALSDFNLYQTGFDASWEIDVFGKARRGLESANALVQAQLEDRRDVMVTLLGEVAMNYLQLRAAQRRLDVAQSNLDAQRKTRKVVFERYRQGLTSKLDLDQSDAQLANTESQLPPLESQIAQAIHELSVLLGQRPTTLRAELFAHAPLPPVPDVIPVGLPSDLLFRRPDLRRAERQLASASALIGQSVAQLYPSISLVGSIGYQSVEPGTLLDWHSRYYSFGPSVSIPIFDGNRLVSQVKVSKAREQESVLQFHQAVLTALKEVENALIAYAKNQQRLDSLIRAEAGNKSALAAATDQYKQGVIDFLNVLDAQRQLLASQDALAQAYADVDTSLISLYKALGGGWQVAPDVPSDHELDHDVRTARGRRP